jgi:hypothetical protein
MTMTKFLRPAAATLTSTKQHDQKSKTLTEEQRQQILQQNRRTIRNLLNSIEGPESFEERTKLPVVLHLEVPSYDIHMLHITCRMIRLDWFDSRVALRRKCRRMNAQLNQRKYIGKGFLKGLALRMNKRNEIELFFSTPVESLTLVSFDILMKFMDDLAVECKLRLIVSRNKSRWTDEINRN